MCSVRAAREMQNIFHDTRARVWCGAKFQRQRRRHRQRAALLKKRGTVPVQEGRVGLR